MHNTTPTQFVEAGGIRFSYRHFGKSSGIPVVLNMHFTGTMDHCGLAAKREGNHLE